VAGRTVSACPGAATVAAVLDVADDVGRDVAGPATWLVLAWTVGHGAVAGRPGATCTCSVPPPTSRVVASWSTIVVSDPSIFDQPSPAGESAEVPSVDSMTTSGSGSASVAL
jgi:hypothetical protein